MVLPAPGGPSIVSVIEERFSDGVEQKIVLGTDAANPGQNYLEIRLYGPMERATQGRKKLGFKPFASAGLTAEAARAMPLARGVERRAAAPGPGDGDDRDGMILDQPGGDAAGLDLLDRQEKPVGAVPLKMLPPAAASRAWWARRPARRGRPRSPGRG